jgi:acyl-CoA thioesterase II
LTDLPREEPYVVDDAVVAETLAFMQVRPDGDGWIGDTPSWFGDVLFGGFVIAQSVHAATCAAPEGRRLHSAHLYFLRPVVAGPPVTYTTDVVRDGRTFSSRRLDAAQAGKPVVAMLSSYTADTDGYEYDLGGPPGGWPPETGPPVDDPDAETGPGPWIAQHLGPSPPAADGTRASTHRIWFKVPQRLPDDDALHTALLGFASDWTGTGGRPLQLEGDITGMVSLDHAVWFHRPARADEWLFYDVQSLVNAGGRGLLRGVMRDADGRVVLSVAQEMRLQVV